MKLYYISDLHFEFQPIYDVFKQIPECDVVVIAGDLDVGANKVIKVLKIVKQYISGKLIYIPGNHEFYGSSYFRESKNFLNNKEELALLGIYILDNDKITIDNVNIVGSIGWPDHSFKAISKVKYNNYNDFNVIDDFSEGHYDWGKTGIEYIKHNLSKDKTNVIVTHWLPTPSCISSRYENNYYNPCFANDWTKLIDKLVKKYKITAWIHGHSHDELDMKYNGISFLRNPFSYPSERKNNNINKNKMITI